MADDVKKRCLVRCNATSDRYLKKKNAALRNVIIYISYQGPRSPYFLIKMVIYFSLPEDSKREGVN